MADTHASGGRAGFAPPGARATGVVMEGHGGRRGAAPRLRLRHRADPRELRRIRRLVGRWASQSGVPEDVTIDLQLAVGEAVANGVEHAYGAGGDTDATVEVEMEVRTGAPDAVVVRVADHGTWRPAPASPGFRGRGLVMIDELAQRVQVLCSPGGTEVSFEIAYPA